MKTTVIVPLVFLAHLAPAPAATAESSADGCAAFEWDISGELAVMRAAPQELSAKPRLPAPALLLVGKHYKVDLMPQAGIEFVTKPEREARSDSPHGAVLQFRTWAAGRYRVSLSSRHWIDLLVDGRIIPSADHQGRAGCQYLHKVVEFELPADSTVVLQLSGQDDKTVSLGITAPTA